MAEIDTTNKFMVAMKGVGSGEEQYLIMNPPRGPISKDDALLLAAWICAIVADDDRFTEITNAVINT